MKLESWNQAYEKKETPWRRQDFDMGKWIEVAGIKSGNAIDLGCGTGEASRWLSKHGFNVEGIDFSDKAIEEAVEQGGDAKFSVYDLENLDKYNFAHEKYDLILDNKVLAFIKDKEKYLNTIKRILSGVFVTQIIHVHDEKQDICVPKEEFEKLITPRFNIKNLITIPTRDGKTVVVYFLTNK